MSLVEVLVVIGIVSALIALLLPSLASARGSARATKCLANLRGIASTIEIYTAQSRGVYPFWPEGVMVPTGPDAPAGSSSQTIGSHWANRVHWASVVAPIAGWRNHYAAWVCSGSPRAPEEPWSISGARAGSVSYEFVSGFYARPETWTSTIGSSLDLLRPVVVSDVSFPASKVQFVDVEAAHRSPDDRSDATIVLFADGHARQVSKAKARPPFTNQLTGTADAWFDTQTGARGVDH